MGRTAANLIYLSHPLAKAISLGCAGRNVTNQLYARSDSRKPTPAFIDLVASAAAIIFTLPKGDMLKGATRCIKRMGILRGNDISTRYRRLDMRCARTKTEASITISRARDDERRRLRPAASLPMRRRKSFNLIEIAGSRSPCRAFAPMMAV